VASERDDRPRAGCPRCGAAVTWSGNPARPFCSITCKLIDLEWLDETYRVPGDAFPSKPDPEESPRRAGE
jgi:endogenous inhibitor of DNA gyrase (YacG/DUF329 family)